MLVAVILACASVVAGAGSLTDDESVEGHGEHEHNALLQSQFRLPVAPDGVDEAQTSAIFDGKTEAAVISLSSKGEVTAVDVEVMEDAWGSNWQVIVKADKKSNFPRSATKYNLLNQNDNSSASYMTVGTLQPWKFEKKGEFKFKLIFKSSKREVTMDWAQKTWLTSRRPAGFRAISMKDNGRAGRWGRFRGLRDCGGNAAFCSTTGWWAAVGQSRHHRRGIPAWPSGFIADSAVLYVERGDPSATRPTTTTTTTTTLSADAWKLLVKADKKSNFPRSALKSNLLNQNDNSSASYMTVGTMKSDAFKQKGEFKFKLIFKSSNREVTMDWAQKTWLTSGRPAGFRAISMKDNGRAGRWGRFRGLRDCGGNAAFCSTSGWWAAVGQSRHHRRGIPAWPSGFIADSAVLYVERPPTWAPTPGGGQGSTTTTMITTTTTKAAAAVSYELKSSGRCSNYIRTIGECSSAAKALKLPCSAASSDGQRGVTYDPPWCYFEGGSLKFNENGQNRGKCTAYDKCLCKTRGGQGSTTRGGQGSTTTTTTKATVAWRIFATSTNSGWAWDVHRLRFRSNGADISSAGCTIFDSGNAGRGYSPRGAFHNGGFAWWGGRKKGGVFYIGMSCSSMANVDEVIVKQGCGSHMATTIQVQSNLFGAGWKTMRTATSVACGAETPVYNAKPVPVSTTNARTTQAPVAPTKAPGSFAKGQMGSSNCPVGMRPVTSAADCRAASAQLHIDKFGFRRIENKGANWPQGCYHLQGKGVYYNRNMSVRPQMHSGCSTICVNGATPSPSPTWAPTPTPTWAPTPTPTWSPTPSPVAGGWCAERCRAQGYCCNDPRTGSNQMISCAQACEMRKLGATAATMLSSNGGICDRTGSSGCHLRMQGVSYAFCRSCKDKTAKCPHGVQHKSECDFGARLNPPGAPTPNPTPSPTWSPTPTPSWSPTPSPTWSPTPSPTWTPTPTPTWSPTPSPTWAPTPSPTWSPTPSPTWSPTPSPTWAPTPTPTWSPTPSPTWAPTPTPTWAPTPSPTWSPTPTPTWSPTPSPTWAPTPTPTWAPTPSPTWAPTPSPTWAPTPTPTWAPTPTPTWSPTPSPTWAPTPSPTWSPTPSPTWSPTPSPTWSPTPSPTWSPTPSPTWAPTPTPSPTWAPTPTPTWSPTPSPTWAPTPSPTWAPTPTPTWSPTPSPTWAPTPTPTWTPTPTPTWSPTPSPTWVPTTATPQAGIQCLAACPGQTPTSRPACPLSVNSTWNFDDLPQYWSCIKTCCQDYDPSKIMDGITCQDLVVNFGQSCTDDLHKVFQGKYFKQGTPLSDICPLTCKTCCK